MAVPGVVIAAGWIPFVVILVLILVFSFIYIRFYQHRYDKEFSSTITSMLALAVALFTLALIPVDIFLVSYMKDENGQFKSWANSTENRKSILDTVLYAYYALYLCVMVFIFIILPFVYFYYEEKDDDEPVPIKSRCCTALKFTIGFVFVAAVLLLIGAFAPLKSLPKSNSTDSEWARISDLLKQLGSNDGEDPLSFTVSCLTLIGMMLFITYTAYGMSAWPMDMIKGRRSAGKERIEVLQHRAANQALINDIREKNRGRSTLSRRNRQRIEELEEENRLIGTHEAELELTERSWLHKCSIVLRPFQIVFGIVFFLIALLIFVSLLLTNIDKAMHSLGWRFGYALIKRTLPNPIDITLVFAEQVYLVDYIIMALIVMYFFFCSMASIRELGIWCFCLRMYRIRPRRTKPQGLLFMCSMLMFIVLAMNIMLYQLTPQYSTYGSQHYQLNSTANLNATVSPPHNGTVPLQVVKCSIQAPPDQCVMTRMSLLLTRFFYKVWFFGACYYWGSWIFLGIFVIGFVVSVVRKRRSAIEGRHMNEDDYYEDDDELIRA